MNKLRLVLDTNVFMVSLAPQYKYRWVYDFERQYKVLFTS